MIPNNQLGNLSNKEMEMMMERYKMQLMKLQKATNPKPSQPAPSPAPSPTPPPSLSRKVVEPEPPKAKDPSPIAFPINHTAVPDLLMPTASRIVQEEPPKPDLPTATIPQPSPTPQVKATSFVIGGAGLNPFGMKNAHELEPIEEQPPIVAENPVEEKELSRFPQSPQESVEKPRHREFPPLGRCMHPPSVTMTTSLGEPIHRGESLTAQNGGSILLRDTILLDKLGHFNRERIPERAVHAKGAGAFGHFTCYERMSAYTKADFLSEHNKTTAVFVRFSTVIGSAGSADTARDARGFAVKFYTEQGNYDLAGLNFPVFPIKDPMKFPDLIHSLKPSPQNNCSYPERFFDFAAKNPETTHAITYLYANEGTIRSYRTMNGFGVNTYQWVNEEGKRVWVKYHWRSQQGVSHLTPKEAMELAGENPTVATEDLYQALARGEKLRYELLVQLLDPQKEEKISFHPLDPTQVWDENHCPLIPIGMMVLDRNPDDYFLQVEQSAFSPSALVPGIELSPDPILEGRAFAAPDAIRYRLGANYAQLPINTPKCPVHNHQMGGSLALRERAYPNINYSPNQLMSNQPHLAEANSKKQIAHAESPVGAGLSYDAAPDYFTQASQRVKRMSEGEREALAYHLACDLVNCSSEVIEGFMTNLIGIGQEFAGQVAGFISQK